MISLLSPLQLGFDASRRSAGAENPIPSASTSDEFFTSAFVSAGGCGLAGIGAPVPAGSGPKLSRTRSELRPSGRACGTYRRGRNAPDNNLPVRPVPAPRRSGPDRFPDHRAWPRPRRGLTARRAKAEFAPADRRARRFVASRWPRPILPPRERPQSPPAKCRSRSGETSALAPAVRRPPRSALDSTASDPDAPAKSARRSEKFWRRDGMTAATSAPAALSLPAPAGVRSATGPAESLRQSARRA